MSIKYSFINYYCRWHITGIKTLKMAKMFLFIPSLEQVCLLLLSILKDWGILLLSVHSLVISMSKWTDIVLKNHNDSWARRRRILEINDSVLIKGVDDKKPVFVAVKTYLVGYTWRKAESPLVSWVQSTSRAAGSFPKQHFVIKRIPF